MALQYSGLTVVNTTFTTTVGTQQELVNGIASALLSAGWTQVAGSSGGADQTFKSATTPQGYAIRVRVFNPATGSCAQLFLHNATGSLTQTTNPMYLLPTAGGTYRVIANGYQVFIFVGGSTTTRTFAAAGVPFVPSFLTGVTTAAGWMHGNATGDTDVTARASFRTVLEFNASAGDLALLYNTTLWANTGSNAGGGSLVITVGARLTTTIGYRYSDGSALIVDPLIAWGLASSTAEVQVVGQLWDAAVITEAFTADVTATFDSHNWWNLTSNNIGTGTTARGSLFLVVP